MEVFLIWAQSLNGYIAQYSQQKSINWTSKADHRWYIKKTKEAGAVLFGRTTYETFNKPLPGRLNIIYSRSKPEELASLSTAQLEQKAGQTQLYYTQMSPQAVVDKVEKAGFNGLSISGGTQIYTLFLKSGLVSKIYATIEHKIFGQGKSIFGEFETMYNLNLVQIKQIAENTVVLEYKLD